MRAVQEFSPLQVTLQRVAFPHSIPPEHAPSSQVMSHANPAGHVTVPWHAPWREQSTRHVWPWQSVQESGDLVAGRPGQPEGRVSLGQRRLEPLRWRVWLRLVWRRRVAARSVRLARRLLVAVGEESPW